MQLLRYRELPGATLPSGREWPLAEQTCRQYVSRKILPHIKLGRTVYFDPRQLDEFLDAHAVQPARDRGGRL